jgi:hypothetical protein
MKKQYVVIGVLVVIAAGWYFVSLNEPKAAPVVTPEPATTTPATTTTEVATGTTSTPTTSDKIELDLTKLQGKDRLYTEEEGKYENLSEEEQKMVRNTYNNECNNSRSNPICTESLFSGDKQARLISLKNDIALLHFPYLDRKKTTTFSGTFPGWTFIYNVRTRETPGSDSANQHMVMGSDYIIRPGYSMDGSTVLQLYRPGMGSFENIIPSFLSNTTGGIENTWTELSEDGHVESLPIVFSGEQITAYHHRYRYTGVNRKYELLSVAPITFDLQTVDIRPISGS